MMRLRGLTGCPFTSPGTRVSLRKDRKERKGVPKESSKVGALKAERKADATNVARKDTGRINVRIGTATLVLGMQEAREPGKAMGKELHKEKVQDPVVIGGRKVERLLSGTPA